MKSKFWVYGRLLLIAASLCLTAYNLWDEKRAGDSAEELLLQYQVLKFGHHSASDERMELCSSQGGALSVPGIRFSG